MSDIDFQNGFIVGMATRGITRSGLAYAPIAWNDDGIFSYFYIDFKKPVADLSVGMFEDSCVISDSVKIPATGVRRISSSIYKIYADIRDAFFGISILGKYDTSLLFSDGVSVPIFSIKFDVAGISPRQKLKYMYDSITMPATQNFGEIQEHRVIEINANITFGTTLETLDAAHVLPYDDFLIVDNATVTLTDY